MKTLIVSLLALSLAASAQDDKRFTPIFGGRRMALVIGNKSYAWKPLVNPVNDANAISKMLMGMGFAQSDVHLVIDANQAELRHSVRQFVESVKPGDLAFVYYSGHGIEVRGANYLLPIDLPADATEGYVEDEAVSAQRLLNELTDQGAAVKVLILDACRDNPLRAAKSTAGGLAQMEGNVALMLFGTQAGRTAADTARSSNSVFAKYLLKDLTEPGVPLREAALHVARNVARETNNKQIPQMYGMMLEDVVLVPGSAAPREARVSPPSMPADQEAWFVVKDSGNAGLLEQFLKEFPQSSYAGVARLKLANLAVAAVSPGTGDAFMTAKRFWDAKDYGQALPLFRRAAEASKTEAYFYLGDMYENGKGGLPKDLHRRSLGTDAAPISEIRTVRVAWVPCTSTVGAA
jgi:TPR repeat protein